MRHTRHIEISLERLEVSVRLDRKGLLRHCAQCGRKTVMLPVEAAAAMTSIPARRLYRWMEEEKLHFIELPGGAALICTESMQSLM